MRRFLYVLLLAVAIFVTQVAALAPSSADTAITIATYLLMVIAPFVPLAQLHFKDSQIVLASMVLALVVALIAQISTGELTAFDWKNVGALALEFGKLWAIQQAVFQLFKDSVKVGPLLTTKPLLVAPQPPAADIAHDLPPPVPPA